MTSRYLAWINTNCLLLLLLMLVGVVGVVRVSRVSHSNSGTAATTNDPGANILALSGIFYRTCDRQRPDSSEERIIT